MSLRVLNKMTLLRSQWLFFMHTFLTEGKTDAEEERRDDQRDGFENEETEGRAEEIGNRQILIQV